MKISFFDSRCNICLKSFQIPKLSDQSYGEALFYDKNSRQFAYLNRFDTPLVETYVTELLQKFPYYQEMNDNKKGTTIVELYAALADGNKEAVLGFNRCPRCGIKYNRVSFKRNYFDDIKLLEFSNFLALKEDEKVTYLERIANLSLRKTLFFRRGLVS